MANARNMQGLTLPISTLPISWYGTLADFDNMPQNTGTVCLELDSDDLCVKHRLRMKLRSARNSFPAMKAVVISKPNQDSHYDLLIDEGISVILTQSTNSHLISVSAAADTNWMALPERPVGALGGGTCQPKTAIIHSRIFHIFPV